MPAELAHVRVSHNSIQLASWQLRRFCSMVFCLILSILAHHTVDSAPFCALVCCAFAHSYCLLSGEVDLCDACGIQLQLENISRVRTRSGSKTETDFHRSSWRTIEILHGLGIGSWSPSWASGFTTYTPSHTSRRKLSKKIGCGHARTPIRDKIRRTKQS